MSQMHTDYVLDTFALMCYLGRDPGCERVAKILKAAEASECTASLCMVNWAETLYMLMRHHGPQAEIRFIDGIDFLPIHLVPADRELSVVAASLKCPGGLSLADCYAAALAQSLDGTVLTGDREFRHVEDIIRIEWLPSKGT